MGFRSKSFATIWEDVTPMSDTMAKTRISISRKDRNSGEYVQDFGGYVTFIGTAAVAKAQRLKKMDRIRLGDVDVTSYYNKNTNTNYNNFNIFSFETQEEIDGGTQGGGKSAFDAPIPDGLGEIDDTNLPY